MKKFLRQQKYLGFGLELRSEYYDKLLTSQADIDWLEVRVEDYMYGNVEAEQRLDKMRELYPLVLHGASLSVGCTDLVDYDYLDKVKKLSERIHSEWISDHLCWAGVNSGHTHELLPMPYTQESLKHVSQRIQRIQDYLGQQILLENVASHVSFEQSAMAEWEFLAEVAKTADCLILLDINNVYVSSINYSFDPLQYIHGLPVDRVKQIHVAGHSNLSGYIIDIYDDEIVQPIWDLYAKALTHLGPVSTMIERDNAIPPFSELLDELDDARTIARRVLDKAIAV